MTRPSLVDVPAVLAVEDNADHATLITMVLRAGLKGCDVRVASSGAAAREYLQNTLDAPGTTPRPGLIVLDMYLGDATGLEILEWISERPQFTDIPVILFTSSTEPGLAKKAYTLGARRVVTKPDNFRELVEVVYQVVPVWTASGSADGVKTAGA